MVKTIPLSTQIIGQSEQEIEAFQKFLKSHFSCPKNKDVEHFITSKAIGFDIHNFSKTYLMIDENKGVVAYFTLAIKNTKTSKTFLKKKINRFYKGEDLTAFLIAQIGKNESIKDNPIKLKDILDEIFFLLKKANKVIGVSAVILEYDSQNEKLKKLYEDQGFALINIKNEEENHLNTMYIVPDFNQ